ncbi:MAG TPA: hypothetical protein VGM29_08705 [Polyangiaceae bacterium]|jgi:hypothetical protein
MSATEKISVSIGREELRQAKQLAGRLGLSLSTFISDAVRQRIEAQARKQAGLEVLSTFPPGGLPSQTEMRSLLARWSGSTGSRRSKVASKRAVAKGKSATASRQRRAG